MILRMTEIRGRILAAEIQGSRRDSRQDFGLRDLEILAKFLAAEIPRDLGRILAAEIQESRRDLGRILAAKIPRVSAGFWPPRFRNLGRILAAEIRRGLGRILAAKISESRRDLVEIQKSRRPKSCNFVRVGKIPFAEFLISCVNV